MSIPDHEIEVGNYYFPDLDGPEEESVVKMCATCRHFAPEVSTLLGEGTKRHPCRYPVPAYIEHFFTLASNMLPTEGTDCAVHAEP